MIMSSLGKGWLKQIRVGSVSFYVARRTDRPLLVVRAKEAMRIAIDPNLSVFEPVNLTTRKSAK